MAAFFTNVCEWPSCGKKCSSLLELIDHIESTHIESDRATLERREQMAASSLNFQATCVPLSYINRFFSNAAAMDSQRHSNLLADMGLTGSSTGTTTTTSAAVAPSPKRKKTASRRPSTAATAVATSAAQADTEREGTSGGVVGDGDNGDSDDSWTYQDSITSEEIMKMMSPDGLDPDKPFMCPVQGCGKRYKNVNGMKYHARNGHKSEKKIRKTHKCKCGKSYRSVSSLRQHQQTNHPGEQQGGAALDSTMLTPTTTSLASELGSLAAQVSSSAASTKASGAGAQSKSSAKSASASPATSSQSTSASSKQTSKLPPSASL